MHRPTMLRLGALALLLFAAPQTRADQIQWTYDWSFSTDVVQHNPSSDDPGKILLLPNAPGKVTGSSSITAVNLKSVSSAKATDPALFTDRPYSLILFIKDLESGLRGAVTFTGVFNGTLSAHSASIHNVFTGPTTQKLHLGQHIYTITIGDFTPPGPPDSKTLGAFGATVKVTHNPEPSSLLLAGLGVPLFGVMLRRKRKAAPDA